MKCQGRYYTPSGEHKCHVEQDQHKDVGGVVKVRPRLHGRDMWRLGPFCTIYCIALAILFESERRCTCYWCSSLTVYCLCESVMMLSSGAIRLSCSILSVVRCPLLVRFSRRKKDACDEFKTADQDAHWKEA
jgi:hypothetical protein